MTYWAYTNLEEVFTEQGSAWPRVRGLPACSVDEALLLAPETLMHDSADGSGVLIRQQARDWGFGAVGRLHRAED